MKTHYSNDYFNIIKLLLVLGYMDLQDEGISGIVIGSFIHTYFILLQPY